jgi:alpha-amylase
MIRTFIWEIWMMPGSPELIPSTPLLSSRITIPNPAAIIGKNIQPNDKPLAYAYILTSEGFPCVFYKDYSKDPGCLGDRLNHTIVNLMWIHQNIADGPRLQRWKDGGVFAYERLGCSHLLVGLNKDKHASRTIHVDTGFPPNTLLHDYTGHGTDIRTSADRSVTLNIPRNTDGLGYVCYSLPGIAGGFANAPSGVTQVFEGAQISISSLRTPAPPFAFSASGLRPISR